MAQYIDKNAVMAEIERRKRQNLLNEGAFEEDIDILSFLDSLEVKEVQEEPVSDELEKVVEEIVDPTVLNAYGVKDIANRLRRTMIEPVSEELEEDINKEWRCYSKDNNVAYINKFSFILIARHFANWQKEKEYTCYEEAFEDGAKWKVENLWKPADGDDLPEIDREVIALLDNGKVGFAHRPPEYWDGKNIVTGKVTRYYPKTYDKGGWNQPNVKWWLDVKLPKEIEL